MKPTAVIRPYVQEFVLGREGDWSQFLLKVGREGVMTALSLPGDLKRFISRSLRGDLEVRFRGLDEPAELLYALGHQLVYALFTSVGIGAALALYLRGEVALARWPAGAAAFFVLLLFGSMWTHRGYRRRRRNGR